MSPNGVGIIRPAHFPKEPQENIAGRRSGKIVSQFWKMLDIPC